MTRSRLGAAGLLIVTFVFGALVGGAATSLADRADHRTRANHPRPSYVERLGTDLGLTDAQKDSVRAVLDRHQPAMDSLWESIRPQFQSERQAIRAQINAFLTAEQQAKYAALQRQDSLRRAEGDRSRNGRRQ
jgi:Spy/CpxP family protein refolding chaperone